MDNVTSNHDVKEYENDSNFHKAQKWQQDLVKINPSYTGWSAGDDNMNAEEGGWNSTYRVDSWEEFSDWKLNDFNECVNFKFSLHIGAKDCSCEKGYSPEAQEIYDSFTNNNPFLDYGWKANITQDEYEALLKEGRVGYTPAVLGKTDSRRLFTREEVNKNNKPGSRVMGHDAINRAILVEARLKRLGIDKECLLCDGKGCTDIEDSATLSLDLWMIHPRKGASRGAIIKNITQENLAEVFAYLREAALRNANRFSKIPE